MIKTIPDIDSSEFLDVSTRNLIVLDDLMADCGGVKRIADLFTKGSHHRNLSRHTLFREIYQGKAETRNISLKVHYIVLFKSPLVKQQVSILTRQVNPGLVQEFMKSYEVVIGRPHGYLPLDLKPTTDDKHGLKSNVLRQENTVLKEYFKTKYYTQPLICSTLCIILRRKCNTLCKNHS